MSTYAEMDQERAQYVERAELRLSALFADDRHSLNASLQAGFDFSGRLSDADGRIRLLTQMNMISYETFEAMLGGGEGFKPMHIIAIWQRLVEAGVFVPGIRGDRLIADHYIDLGRLLAFLRDATFPNIFSPPSVLHRRYAPATIAIDVETSIFSDTEACHVSGESRGSGFIVRTRHDGPLALITAKHNIDTTSGLVTKVKSIAAADGSAIDVGQPYLSPRLDVAVYPLRGRFDGVPFAFGADTQIFDEVFTIGYPLVPGAANSLLGHRGEVNGHVDLYLDPSPAMIISNLVSPGSSGCPVIDQFGRCVGMTIRWLEANYDAERARFSAALPAVLIKEAIEEAQLSGRQTFDSSL